MENSCEATDKAMMARCIELSRMAVSKGEYPFGTVIGFRGKIVAEGINSSIRDGDVTRHAEIIALSHAQNTIGREQLRQCTLYSNIEPCAMCAYCIREASIGRVVFALGSPVMGGLSKWNVLRDDGLSDRIPEIFGAVPEVVSGVLLREDLLQFRFAGDARRHVALREPGCVTRVSSRDIGRDSARPHERGVARNDPVPARRIVWAHRYCPCVLTLPAALPGR